MHSITKTIKRLAIAAATGAAITAGAAGIASAEGWAPATIVEASPVGRVEAAGEATTYLYGGRTRVDLPEDVVAELNAWADGYCERLEEWAAEDGEGSAAYYGGMEEGFNYATQTIMARLGYLDGYYRQEDEYTGRWFEADATLADVPEGWDETHLGETFLAWDTASFGSLD